MARSSRRNHPASTRRQTRPTATPPEIDLRPIAEDGSRPPQLDLQIIRRLKILLIANIIPFIALGILAYLLMTNRIKIEGIAEDRLWSIVLVMLVALVVVAAAVWVLLPLGRWLREYPKWFFVHQSKALWFFPLVGGYLYSIAIWLVSIGLILLSLFLIGRGLWELIAQFFATRAGG